jgi:predicted kinase
VTARRLHLLGASGSGTTTLGRALAQRLGCPHFDTDDWLASLPGPVLRLEDTDDVETRLARVLARLAQE